MVEVGSRRVVQERPQSEDSGGAALQMLVEGHDRGLVREHEAQALEMKDMGERIMLREI